MGNIASAREGQVAYMYNTSEPDFEPYLGEFVCVRGQYAVVIDDSEAYKESENDYYESYWDIGQTSSQRIDFILLEVVEDV